MSHHSETNPHFLQQQPLLRSGPAPSHPEHDSHMPLRQHKDHRPLGPWSSQTQRPGHEPQVSSMPNPEPLGPWTSIMQRPPQHPRPEPAPKSKRQKGPPKESKPTGTGFLQPPLQASNHHAILPRVPPPQEQGQPAPSDSPANQQAHPAHEKSSRPGNQQGHRIHIKERRTKLPTWFAAIFCAIFWIVIILGGLIVLIVYLVFRPKSPWFDIANVNLNAAYLDMGYLLNADLILLVNFTNPNHKVSVDFSSMYLDLYFENTMIATQYVQPFSAPRSKSMLAAIHMMSSQVPLAIKESLLLQQQIQNSSVTFDLKGKFRARSNFGSLMRYSYWLHGLCRVIVSSPPTGVLKGKRCITKQ